jgi:hypothetical protein
MREHGNCDDGSRGQQYFFMAVLLLIIGGTVAVGYKYARALPKQSCIGCRQIMIV